MVDYGDPKPGLLSMHMRPAVVATMFLLALLFFVILPVSATVYMYNGTEGTIQDLINSTSTGDSIFLPTGIYHENLIIEHAIVFGAQDTNNPPAVVTSGNGAGIILAADGITLNGLNLSGTARTGLLVQSNNNRISDITVQGFSRGIELNNAADNIFSGNTVTNNSVGVTVDRSSRSNTFFLNRFDNPVNVAGQSADSQWSSSRQDYSYNGSSFTGPLGNFWSAYTGTDSDDNGVGDSAYPVLADAPAAQSSGTTETGDRAPLIRYPVAYSLLVKTTVSPMNSTGGRSMDRPDNLPALGENLQQQPSSQNPSISVTPGGQGPVSSGIPSSIPGRTTPPPGGMFLAILLDFWWVILIVVIISVVVGVWFERSRRKAQPATHIEYVEASTTANATVVKRPGTGGLAAGDWKDQSYFAAHLPSALEKKYPDAEYMGEGGVGRVFRAWDTGEQRPVAVKIPIRFDEITGSQFTKELHIWQGLHHKNIVEMYAANVFPMPYIEMEYIESSLAVKKFPLETERAVKIITGVAEGLRYAHEQGIVHRDIKPENILITAEDLPKITDWGLAKALTDTKQTGLISFSLNYAAPEQLAPNIYGEAGKWTDIYQLGVLFYEMVTGRLPFTGAGMGEITQAILHNTPLPPEPAGRNAEAITAIITKCLQKKPQDRYTSVADILNDLHHLKPEE